MKRYIMNICGILIFMLVASGNSFSQEAKKLYDPAIDGMKQLKESITTANSGGKHVLIQYGGNWCSWCIKFNAFSKADPEISKIIEENYVQVKLNYSPENKNEAANTYLGNPIRFGFPVFIILDGKGNVLHIQDSALLEEGDGYSQKKVVGFISNWTASAIIPHMPEVQVKK
jgi:thioredoxin-related protein